ncbi:beta-lactamase family protein [candidate division WOR-3 bacterium]|nr:beta-lactamase family protein [candidate division WOR-3 bacterium]
MSGKLNKQILDKIVAGAVARKHIYGAVFHVLSGDSVIDLTSAAGNLREDSQYYIASINKLFISAIILKLDTEGKLDMRDKISKYIPGETVRGLNVYKGKDHSGEIAIVHLMSHTSGIPCYLTDRQADGKREIAMLEAGIDRPWPIDRVIQEVKRMKSHFPPGRAGRAKYSDTNFQILSLIIENITGEPMNIVLKNLFQELSLARTYVYEDTDGSDLVPIYYKSEIVKIPLFLASTKNDIVSTAEDQMTFLRAFFNGYFSPKNRLKELEKWNNIFFPFKYGIGIQKFYIPRVFSPLHPVPDMIGHAGSTGSVAYHVPDLDIYITGTTNQQARPNVAFQTMIKIANRLR